MDLTLLSGLAAAPIITALISALVKPFVTDARWYPSAAVVLGVAWNLLIASVAGDPLLQAVVVGVVVGLAASGLYSAGKTNTPA